MPPNNFKQHRWKARCSNWISIEAYTDSKVHRANIGPIWVLSAPDGPHVGPMNFAIRVMTPTARWVQLDHPEPNFSEIHMKLELDMQGIVNSSSNDDTKL